MSGAGDQATWAHFWEALPSLYLEPIVTAVFAGMVLGAIGVYVVTRRMVFISAALSQLSAAGVALAFFLGLGAYAGAGSLLADPTLWALALALAGTLLFRLDPARLGLTRDSLLGLTYAVASAVVLALGTRIAGEAHDISAILFGSAVAVRSLDLWLTVGVGGGFLLLHVLLLRGLALVTFDPVSARVQRLPVAALDIFLFVSIAVCVAITTRALGALPVFAFTVLPAMGALALTRHLGHALALAALFGATSGAVGYAYSFLLRLPVGASQALVAGVVCVLALGARLAFDRNMRPGPRITAALGAAAAVALALLPLGAGESEPAADPHPVHQHVAHRAPPHDMAPGNREKLIATLRGSEDPGARADAAHELSHTHGAGVREALIAALADEDWSVRAEAVESLGAHPSAEVPPELLRVLASDENAWVRAAAAGALCHFGDPSVAAALRKAAKDDPDAEVRAAASQHLKECL